ncbi:hypothetical protein PHYPSEUDO_010419 [Phytophthora pseudosyringae]|uniref:Uncharacterized protein n=1 Tax=Phytophthora pseudosyringae TaxID=221518 RepID=A0A8T1VA75_9STRA|nr:hypothetical protein PHYPSEUDO_010419 [Phytophthora pseudosyringae]
MAPTVSSSTASPPAPVPTHDSSWMVVRMLNYPKNQQDPRLHDYIANSLNTDLSDIDGTWRQLLDCHAARRADADRGHGRSRGKAEQRRRAATHVGQEQSPPRWRRAAAAIHVGAMDGGAPAQQDLAHHPQCDAEGERLYFRAGYIETDVYLTREKPPVYGVVKLEKASAPSAL